MHYPIAIEEGNSKYVYGVIVPDLHGCFSAGDSLEDAISQAKEAIALHLEGLIADGKAIPPPTPVSEFRKNPEYAGFVWEEIEVCVPKDGC